MISSKIIKTIGVVAFILYLIIFINIIFFDYNADKTYVALTTALSALYTISLCWRIGQH